MNGELYPMSLSPERQYEIFVLAMTAGLGLGAVYCMIAAFRRSLRTKRLADDIADFLFVLLGGAAFFILSVAQTGGARLFVLAGMLAGLLVWRFTVGRLEVLALSAVFSVLARAAGLLLGRPYDKIKQNLKNVFVKNKSKSKKSGKITEKGLQQKADRVYNILE